MNILEIKHLYKKFGSNEVIRDLSLSVPSNTVFGFIGKNGAGKTTTMKMILGLLKADKGNITVAGEQVAYGQTNTNRFIGYLPDVPEFYNFMNSLEYLKLCGEITGMNKKSIVARSKELIQLVGLEDAKKKKIGGFSRGMKQRLGIAQALLNEPRLLICDEPTSALDPVGRKEILDIMKSVKDKTTIVFSTHILSDVERICDDIAILKNGKIALTGTLADIKSKHAVDSLRIIFQDMMDQINFQKYFMTNDTVTVEKVENNTLLIHSSHIEETQSSIIRVLYETKILPVSYELLEPTLESLFLEVVE
ncbi:ABC transporter ATP-binding protein [Vallitalea longa]|uniref:ABC transporter ATP-binding protein n=1 Tax=Vallitalea longa TaxID=2936439 RepID=A0A9W5Y8F6_9FIRM|nr:ABC transporter ATP-binding protein [Vallitalea longa]GKX27653.1 ABC transporter ATP-binding protein [Vallitalea longa]